MSNTILVTGGAGFIGSHVIDRLIDQGHQVICLDNFNDYYPPQFKESNIAKHANSPHFTLYRTDICDLQSLSSIFTKHKINQIIHLAARAGVRPSIEDPILYANVNVVGTTNIFELAHRHNIKRVVYASSSSVYGNQEKIPFSEMDNVDYPISPYAATKKATELLAYTYHHLYGMETVGLRFFTVYGERGRPDMAPYIFTERILTGKPIKKFGDGSTKRDYTYVSDIVAGILACLDAKVECEVFNLGNNSPVSLNELISTIEELTGKKAIINNQSMQPGDVLMTYADIDKASKMLGYAPKTPLEIGLKRFTNWYRESRLQKNTSANNQITTANIV